jgi:uncharacterized membrane protein
MSGDFYDGKGGGLMFVDFYGWFFNLRFFWSVLFLSATVFCGLIFRQNEQN